MIDQMWWQQNAFIIFMPYGEITHVDTGEKKQLTQSDCASNSLRTDNDKLLTVCDTNDFGWKGFLGSGMARLNWFRPYDPNLKRVDKNGHGKPSNSNESPRFDSSNANLNITKTLRK